MPPTSKLCASHLADDGKTSAISSFIQDLHHSHGLRKEARAEYRMAFLTPSQWTVVMESCGLQVAVAAEQPDTCELLKRVMQWRRQRGDFDRKLALSAATRNAAGDDDDDGRITTDTVEDRVCDDDSDGLEDGVEELPWLPGDMGGIDATVLELMGCLRTADLRVERLPLDGTPTRQRGDIGGCDEEDFDDGDDEEEINDVEDDDEDDQKEEEEEEQAVMGLDDDEQDVPWMPDDMEGINETALQLGFLKTDLQLECLLRRIPYAGYESKDTLITKLMHYKQSCRLISNSFDTLAQESLL